MERNIWKDKKLPWEPADYDDDVIYAVRAVAQGVASDGQQKLFWRWLMYVTKGSDEFQSLSFRPEDLGGARGTAFAEGKRFVGIQVRKMLAPELTPHGDIDEFGRSARDLIRDGIDKREAARKERRKRQS